MSLFGSLSQKLRRCSLLPALLLSLLIHFLVFGGVLGMMPAWFTPEPEIKALDARIVSGSPKVAAAPLEKPKKPEDEPQPKKEMQPTEIPLPDPIPVPQAFRSEAEPTEEEGEDARLLEGDDENAPWPDITPRFEDAQEELESETVERWFVDRYLPDGRVFPSKGEIEYRVYRGEKQLEIGKASFSWALWQKTYRFSTKMQTSGLIGVLRDEKLETESLGIISEKFHPLRYQVKRAGRVVETNFFDWDEHTLRVEIGRKKTVLPLRYESQDLLSLQGQLPFWIGQRELLRAKDADPETGEAEEATQEEAEAMQEAEEVAQEEEEEDDGEEKTDWRTWEKTVWIATGKRYDATRIVAVGEEYLELGDRLLTTRHFRVSGRTETDFWLAQEFYWLPVQIRHRDRRGDVYEQRLERYEFQVETEETEEEEAMEPGEEEQP